MSTRTLHVLLQGQLVGELIQNKHGQMSFRYTDEWLKDAASKPLSRSLPLRTERFSRKECQGFFAGTLPEQSKRQIIARNLGISPENDFAMLERIGGECAGAITFVPPGTRFPTGETPAFRELTTAELANILRELPRRPLMAGEHGVRLSLAGAQDKLAVRVSGKKIALPLGGAPSTHIIKPAIEHFPLLVFNEAFCMRLAGLLGLNAARVNVGRVDEIDYLLVERYDRTIEISSSGEEIVRRDHQEDFCQALGIIPERKYQSEGGPSLKQCFGLLRDVSTRPVHDLQALLNAIIFNVLIGNHDAHAKNFSLLYTAETRFAPLYDLVSTAYYPELSGKMAMKIGTEYEFENLRPGHFDHFAKEAGLSKPIVVQRVLNLTEKALASLNNVLEAVPQAQPVAELVRHRCSRILKTFGAAD